MSMLVRGWLRKHRWRNELERKHTNLLAFLGVIAALSLTSAAAAQVFTPEPKPRGIKKRLPSVSKQQPPVTTCSKSEQRSGQNSALPPSGYWAEYNLSYPSDGSVIHKWAISSAKMTAKSSFIRNDGIRIIVNYEGHCQSGWNYRVGYKRSDGIVGSVDFNFSQKGSIWVGSGTIQNTKGGRDNLQLTYLGNNDQAVSTPVAQSFEVSTATGEPVPPAPLTAEYDTAYRAYTSGRVGAGDKQFELFIGTNPDFVAKAEAQFWLGKSYLKSSKRAMAVRAFYDSHKTNPMGRYAPLALLNLGDMLSSLNKFPEGCEAWNRLEKDYTSPQFTSIRFVGAIRRSLIDCPSKVTTANSFVTIEHLD